MIRNLLKKATTPALAAIIAITGCGAASEPNLTNAIANTHALKREVQVAPDTYVRGYGTTFKIKRGLKNYYVTNRHVIEGGPETGLLWRTGGTRDDNLDDDIRLHLAGVDDDSDLAILYSEEPFGTPSFIRPPRAEPRLGEEVYTIGYPFGVAKLIDRGIVASERQRRSGTETDWGPGWYLSNDLAPGVSGSPAYVMREGRPHIIGVVAGGLSTATNAYVIDIDEADDLLKKVLKRGKK